ncbi:GntR family transcriptional regulator [Mycolicibacterium diernhoferi]|uniref:hypothetical protein n=1 Tax=Mycolicibacterium diernhoferi TaxID=1801 RepID=UPI001055108E|nr:hypothetical protein [Mycolicibacterium diernhoferi]
MSIRHRPRPAVGAHRRLVDEIAAGNAAEAERIARKHLAATQSLLLERFTDDVVRAARGAKPHERRTC